MTGLIARLRGLAGTTDNRASALPEAYPPEHTEEGPRLVLLLPDAAGIASYQMESLADSRAARHWLESWFRGRIPDGIVGFWALTWSPDEAAAPITGAEAVVIVRDARRRGVVYLFSFPGMTGATDFIRKEMHRGLTLAQVLLYWAYPVKVCAGPAGAALIDPSLPPPRKQQQVPEALDALPVAAEQAAIEEEPPADEPRIIEWPVARLRPMIDLPSLAQNLEALAARAERADDRERERQRLHDDMNEEPETADEDDVLEPPTIIGGRTRIERHQESPEVSRALQEALEIVRKKRDESPPGGDSGTRAPEKTNGQAKNHGEEGVHPLLSLPAHQLDDERPGNGHENGNGHTNGIRPTKGQANGSRGASVGKTAAPKAAAPKAQRKPAAKAKAKAAAKPATAKTRRPATRKIAAKKAAKPRAQKAPKPEAAPAPKRENAPAKPSTAAHQDPRALRELERDLQVERMIAEMERFREQLRRWNSPEDDFQGFDSPPGKF